MPPTGKSEFPPPCAYGPTLAWGGGGHSMVTQYGTGKLNINIFPSSYT